MGLQEARTGVGAFATDDFFVYCSGASDGNFGCEFWASRTCVDAKTKRDVFLAFEDIVVLHADPRRLLVSINSAPITCVFLVLHAPTAKGRNRLNPSNKNEISKYWDGTSSILRSFSCMKKSPLVVMADANGRIGGTVSQHVGCFCQDEQDFQGECFHEFLAEWMLFCPQTFDTYFNQAPQHTFGKNGSRHRLDFVAFPLSWMQKISVAGPWPWISQIHQGKDHVVVVASLCTSLMAPVSGFAGGTPPLTRILFLRHCARRRTVSGLPPNSL